MTPTTLLTADGGTPPASQIEEFLDWFSQQGSAERNMVIHGLRIIQRYAPPRDAQVEVAVPVAQAVQESAPKATRKRADSGVKADAAVAPAAPALVADPPPAPAIVMPALIQPTEIAPPAPTSTVTLPWSTREEMVAAFKVELKRVGEPAFSDTLKKHNVMFGQLAIDQRSVDILADIQKPPKELF